MPEREVLSDFPWELSFDDLAKAMHIRRGTGQEEELRGLVDQARAIGRPRALFRVAYIDERGEDYVVLDGVRLTSSVLRLNLDPVHRAFIYCCTCGAELARWTEGLPDLVQRYWAEGIQLAALRAATTALNQHLAQRYGLEKSSSQAPGSLPNWPLEQQREVFGLLGDTESLIGVRLTDHYLMIPAKSVSGIRFPTEVRFESCQLCAREACSGRRLPYDPQLKETRYRL
jgi:hypothetical protein